MPEELFSYSTRHYLKKQRLNAIDQPWYKDHLPGQLSQRKITETECKKTKR
jgi:hypothetical protein